MVILFAGKLWLEKEQSTTVSRAGSLRNTVWHDNLGRAKNLLAGRTKLSCSPKNYHSQSIGSALLASPLCHKFGLGPSGLAIRLSGRLSTKTQPNCRLSPAGLTFRASHMLRPLLFRPLGVGVTVSNVSRSTPTTPSVVLL